VHRRSGVPTRSPADSGQAVAPLHLPVSEQDSKLKVGDSCLQADTLERAGAIEEVDEAARLIRIKLGLRSGRLPERLSVVPTGPLDTHVLTDASFASADSLIAGDHRYAALEGILHRDPPVIEGLAPGSPIVSPASDATAQVIDAVSRLRAATYLSRVPGRGQDLHRLPRHRCAAGARVSGRGLVQ